MKAYSDRDGELEHLKAMHTREAIRKELERGPRHSHLRDFIYGAVDGIVTTFAIVAGVAGANLSLVIVVILGMVNLVADGFSMAVSNYLATRAEAEMRERVRNVELRHIEQIPEGEKEEIRQIYARKGFKGEALEQVVETIASDKDIWVDTMIQEEFGLPKTLASPHKAAMVTFVAFIIAGMAPLLPYVYQWLTGTQVSNAFRLSSIITAIAFFSVGALKGRYVEKRWFISGFETLFVGGLAACLAYFVGLLFRGVAG